MMSLQCEEEEKESNEEGGPIKRQERQHRRMLSLYTVIAPGRLSTQTS